MLDPRSLEEAEKPNSSSSKVQEDYGNFKEYLENLTKTSTTKEQGSRT